MDTTSTEELEDYVGKSCDWYDIPCHTSSFAEWMLDVLLFIPRKLWQLLLEGLASLVEAIPVPDFFTSAASVLGNIPPGVMWLGEIARLEEGIVIILAAYVIRFTIRRIPVIG